MVVTRADFKYQNILRILSEKEVQFWPEDKIPKIKEKESQISKLPKTKQRFIQKKDSKLFSESLPRVIYRQEVKWLDGKTGQKIEKPKRKINKFIRRKKKLTPENKGLYTQICSNGIDEENKKNLILLHGLTSKGATWRYVVKLFARMGWKVITPDLPNHGNSGKLKGIKTLHEYSEEIYRMLKGIGINEGVIATSSWSAFLAQAFTRDHPDFVKGLYLSGPQFSIEDIPLGGHYQTIRPILKALPIDITKMIKLIQAHFRAKTPGEKAAYLKSGAYGLNKEILIELADATYIFKSGISPEINVALQFADKDSLSIKDKIMKYYMLSKTNKPNVYIIKNSGHHIQQESPYGFVSALFDFTQGIDYAPEINEETESIIKYKPSSYHKLV